MYVSCGEHWINPDLSIAQQKKQIFLRNLASDISKIQTFCSTRKIEGKHWNYLLYICIARKKKLDDIAFFKKNPTLFKQVIFHPCILLFCFRLIFMFNRVAYFNSHCTLDVQRKHTFFILSLINWAFFVSPSYPHQGKL